MQQTNTPHTRKAHNTRNTLKLILSLLPLVACTLACVETTPVNLSRGSERLIDLNGDGSSEGLEISLRSDIKIPAAYTWQGDLVDGRGNWVATASGAGTLDAATPFTFAFGGESIRASHHSGPYALTNVTVNQDSRMAPALYAQYPDIVYKTKEYAYGQFVRTLAPVQVTATVNGPSMAISLPITGQTAVVTVTGNVTEETWVAPIAGTNLKTPSGFDAFSPHLLSGGSYTVPVVPDFPGVYTFTVSTPIHLAGNTQAESIRWSARPGQTTYVTVEVKHGQALSLVPGEREFARDFGQIVAYANPSVETTKTQPDIRPLNGLVFPPNDGQLVLRIPNNDTLTPLSTRTLTVRQLKTYPIAVGETLTFTREASNDDLVFVFNGVAGQSVRLRLQGEDWTDISYLLNKPGPVME